MKKEIYITILLFAIMLFALAITLVQGHHCSNIMATNDVAVYVGKTNFGLAAKNSRVRVTSNLRVHVSVLRLIPCQNQRSYRRGIAIVGGVYTLMHMQFETGFAGCELERPIVHRAAPFTSSHGLKVFC